MLPNKDNLKHCITAFSSLSKTNSFTYEALEARAEELENQMPGAGYQISYNEHLVQTFREFVDKLTSDDKPNISFSEFINCFDKMMIEPYLKACNKQGINVNIKTNYKEFNPNTLMAFKQILDTNPDSNVFRTTALKFDRDELTLDSVYADAKKRANTTPTRKEALELASRAEVLEIKNQERGFWDTLFNLRTYIKELFAIRALRTLASKAGDINDLEFEAKNGNIAISQVRSQVDYELLNAQAMSDKEIDLEHLNEMDDKDLENYFDEIEFSTMVNVNHLDLKGNEKTDESVFINHDVSLDLDDINDEIELEDSDKFLSDESIIEDDAPFELDSEDNNLLTSIADELEASESEPERFSLIINELSENSDSFEISPKIEDSPTAVKEKTID